MQFTAVLARLPSIHGAAPAEWVWIPFSPVWDCSATLRPATAAGNPVLERQRSEQAGYTTAMRIVKTMSMMERGMAYLRGG